MIQLAEEEQQFERQCPDLEAVKLERHIKKQIGALPLQQFLPAI